MASTRTRLDAHAKVKWPPPPARVKADKFSRTPDAQDYRNAILQRVCDLNPQEGDVLEVCVRQPGDQQDVLLIVHLKDSSIREPLFRFLKGQMGKTVAEIGEIAVDF